MMRRHIINHATSRPRTEADPIRDYSIDRPVEIEYGFGGRRSEETSCQASNTISDDILGSDAVVNRLRRRLQQLEIENSQLRGNPIDSDSVNIQVFHCLRSQDQESDTTYLYEPEWEKQGEQITLKCQFPVPDPVGYSQHHNMAFIIYKQYNLCQQELAVEAAVEASEALGKPEACAQWVVLTSKEMVEAMKAFFAQTPSFSDVPKLAEKEVMAPPYTWWYHRRKFHNIRSLPTRQAQLVMALVDWIEASYASLFSTVDDQLHKVSSKDIVPRGYVVLDHPQPDHDSVKDEEKDQQDASRNTVSWRVKCRSLEYSGEFYLVKEDVKIAIETELPVDEVDIATLSAMPLKYAAHSVQDRLAKRAEMWWTLRGKKFVSYEGGPSYETQAVQRFMIDFATYKELHPDNEYSRRTQISSNVDEYSPGDNQGPQAPEMYLFPTMVPGFDLRRKIWGKFNRYWQVIRDAVWNDKAFSNLVADENMKELILASVTNQLETEKGTDLIDNKGNGLIMLLHGSPGTGKTFTAESVAEIAKKPLYPVTCGDIGTEPEQVEKNLRSVLHLGKIWDCVVLLDEAEVFLEQRTLQDLKRSALVSVFLRTLEYYEGILILTTNRVGTFDEAFKSRIQLALRYEKLQGHQRKQIWQNFFARLKEIGEGDKINFNDLELNLDELSRYEMNGRQIRNSITTARQLAKYRGKKMNFSHLKRAITVAEKFDRYLADVQEGIDEGGGRGEDGRYSDESIARQDGVR
ncbi:hypothetical protein MRS44_003544 [Fusarium solani]|uniref:uncharacterized protein n=1 Tax=Fusarium solani TaxID=169388 RepID=UPI0032C3DD4E|nr:hypothetical protein MRS44_003544 [Fusarium solani]